MNIKSLLEIVSDDILEQILYELFNIIEKEKCLSLMQNLKSINHNLFLHFFQRFYRNGVTLIFGTDREYTKIYLIDFIINDDSNGECLVGRLSYSIPIKTLFGNDGANFLKNISIDKYTKEITSSKFKVLSIKDLRNIFTICNVDFSTLINDI